MFESLKKRIRYRKYAKYYWKRAKEIENCFDEWVVKLHGFERKNGLAVNSLHDVAYTGRRLYTFLYSGTSIILCEPLSNEGLDGIESYQKFFGDSKLESAQEVLDNFIEIVNLAIKNV